MERVGQVLDNLERSREIVVPRRMLEPPCIVVRCIPVMPSKVVPFVAHEPHKDTVSTAKVEAVHIRRIEKSKEVRDHIPVNYVALHYAHVSGGDGSRIRLV